MISTSNFLEDIAGAIAPRQKPRMLSISRLAVVSSVLAVFVAASCGQQEKGPTYHKEIATIMASQCAECHQVGGIGPFPLTTYAEVKAHKDEIAFATGARLMPPSNIDASGACRTFQDSRWLSEEQIKDIKEWADADAPEGDASIAAPKLPTIDALDDANLPTGMTEAYLPKPSPDFPNDDYRCFLVDGSPTDGFVTGYEIVPGHPQEVHHMILVGILDEQTEQNAIAQDDAEEGPGFSCFSNFVDGNVDVLAGWAPGKNTVRYPEGTGLQVAAGRKLVMQVHYNLLAGPPEEDITSLKLRVVPTVQKQAMIALLANDSLDVPPGQKNAAYGFSQPLIGLGDNLEVYGVFPHMHTLGQTLRFDVHPLNDNDPKDQFCLADVWKWDFHWQQLFFYDQPQTITPDDVVDVNCTYDTTHRTTDVKWGESTQDEMCLIGVYVARPNGGSLADIIPN